MIGNGRRVRFGHHQRKNYFKFRVSGKSADFPETHFHRRGRRGNRHLQRRFLRKCGAAGGRLLPREGRLPPAGGKMSPQVTKGESVAQRLRGYKSAEPEKTVKRSSRRTGVNLQFFPVEPSSLGLKGASSPFFVAPARRNRWHFSGSLLVSKENIPGKQKLSLQPKKPPQRRRLSLITVCALLRSRMRCGGRAARHGCSGYR